jgi:NADH-quinone oxidoreductase subunit N
VNASAVAESLGNAFALIVPEAILLVAACVLFLGSTFRADRQLWGVAALGALVIAGIALWIGAGRIETIEAQREALERLEKTPTGQPVSEAKRALDTVVFTSPLLQTRLALLIKVIALVGGALLVLFSWEDLSDRYAGEYHACLLLIVAGLSLTGAANELVILFLALELISIPTYVILYLQRSDRPAQEAAAKYFLLSVFSSALLLFGFSYLYGLAGTTNIPGILDALGRDAAHTPLLAVVALVMVVAGLGFKITAVPFHFYAPDVYQGTTPAAAGLLAFVPKVAGFVALLLVLGYTWPGKASASGLQIGPEVARGYALGPQVPILFVILAIMTMCIGNVLALLQDNIKRLLAYSSVSHAGYMLIGLAVAPDLSLAARQGWLPRETMTLGADAVLFYLVAYGAMTLGAFAVISYLSTPDRPIESVAELAGLSSSHPGVALLMAIFMFSLIGIPLTVGFAGKLLIFLGALTVPPEVELADHAAWFRRLALIAAINAAIAGWYYLRVVGVMYLRTPLKPIEKSRAWPGLAAIWICAALTIALGVYPWPAVRAARLAIIPEPSVPEQPQAQR